jgi:hypothetical protein
MRRPAAVPSLALAGEQLPARSPRGAPEVSHAAGDPPLYRNQSLPGSAENDEEDAGKQETVLLLCGQTKPFPSSKHTMHELCSTMHQLWI